MDGYFVSNGPSLHNIAMCNSNTVHLYRVRQKKYPLYPENGWIIYHENLTIDRPDLSLYACQILWKYLKIWRDYATFTKTTRFFGAWHFVLSALIQRLKKYPNYAKCWNIFTKIKTNVGKYLDYLCWILCVKIFSHHWDIIIFLRVVRQKHPPPLLRKY